MEANKGTLPNISFRIPPRVNMGRVMSGEKTPTAADCDLGTVAFVDACGSKHVAQVVGKML